MCVTVGHSCNGCDLGSTMYKYDLWEGDLFVLKGAASEAGKHLYRDDNV